MEPEFQGKPSLLRHIPRAERVMMTWILPQSIRNIYRDHVLAQCNGKNVRNGPSLKAWTMKLKINQCAEPKVTCWNDKACDEGCSKHRKVCRGLRGNLPGSAAWAVMPR